MSKKLTTNIQTFYDKMDLLKERLEFVNDEMGLKILDEALQSLNNYLTVIEKFDRTGKKKDDKHV